MSVNKVILVGNVGRDPESRYLPNGDAVVGLSLATTEKWKGKDGSKAEATQWHRVSFFGKLAEIVGEYVKKGSQIYVEGRIEYREYEKDGVKRYSTDIIADKLQMLGGKPNGEGRRREAEGSDTDDSSIPF